MARPEKSHRTRQDTKRTNTHTTGSSSSVGRVESLVFLEGFLDGFLDGSLGGSDGGPVGL